MPDATDRRLVLPIRAAAQVVGERLLFVQEGTRHHFRTEEGAEVGAVLERVGRHVAGVEVKLSGTAVTKDFRGLKKLREAVGSRFTAGVVQYDGEFSIPFGEGLLAVPLSRLWTGKT